MNDGRSGQCFDEKDKSSFYLQVVNHHLEGAAQDAAEEVGVAQLRMALGQLHKGGQRVVVQHQRAFFVIRAPL